MPPKVKILEIIFIILVLEWNRDAEDSIEC